MNPRAGDESPTADELVAEAERLGIETHVLAPGDDAAVLAADAAERGAPTLGIAGGDGSLGAVAEVALGRDLPFVCVPFGTRNHFAGDLGLDCDDPLGTLAAFRGEERRVDAASVGERTFLNNVSLGLYASLVHDPGHETKNRLAAALRMLPAAFGRERRPLELRLDTGDGPDQVCAFVLLVTNNDYALDAVSDLGARSRLDEGRLHVYVVEAVGRIRLVTLFARALAGRARRVHGYVEYVVAELGAESSHRRIHTAIDGEPAVLTSPLRFEIRPKALRVLVPPA